MFTENLSTALLRKMNERELTQESLAEICNMSERAVGNIIRGRSVPKLDSFEKICSGLEVSPDDLLISDKSRQGNKAIPMCVDTLYHGVESGKNIYAPICPSCNILLHNDWQSYCDNCGQKLSWKKYMNARVLSKKPPQKRHKG